MLYGGYLVALSLIFMYDAQPASGDKFTEYSLTEFWQEGSLFVVVMILLQSALTNKYMQPLSLIVGGFFLMALIREFDAFLDDYVFDGAWQLLVLIVLIGLIFSIYKTYTVLPGKISSFIRSYPFGLMVAGFLVTFAFSRLFGESFMWQAVMEDNYMRSVKNAVEESVELMGYSIILFSTIEYAFWAKSMKPAEL